VGVNPRNKGKQKVNRSAGSKRQPLSLARDCKSFVPEKLQIRNAALGLVDSRGVASRYLPQFSKAGDLKVPVSVVESVDNPEGVSDESSCGDVVPLTEPGPSAGVMSMLVSPSTPYYFRLYRTCQLIDTATTMPASISWDPTVASVATYSPYSAMTEFSQIAVLFDQVRIVKTSLHIIPINQFANAAGQGAVYAAPNMSVVNASSLPTSEIDVIAIPDVKCCDRSRVYSTTFNVPSMEYALTTAPSVAGVPYEGCFGAWWVWAEQTLVAASAIRWRIVHEAVYEFRSRA